MKGLAYVAANPKLLLTYPASSEWFVFLWKQSPMGSARNRALTPPASPRTTQVNKSGILASVLFKTVVAENQSQPTVHMAWFKWLRRENTAPGIYIVHSQTLCFCSLSLHESVNSSMSPPAPIISQTDSSGCNLISYFLWTPERGRLSEVLFHCFCFLMLKVRTVLSWLHGLIPGVIGNFGVGGGLLWVQDKVETSRI